MYIGSSLFLIAAGAILRYGVSDRVDGINLAVIGLILIIVGAIGLAASLLQTLVWSDRRRTGVVDGQTVTRSTVDRRVDL
jgi:Domain of unknown function (DUF6458)